jgi:septum formation protein
MSDNQMVCLLKNIDRFNVILASESPRRYELLKMIGLDFDVQPSHLPEVHRDHLTPVAYALDNARKKGWFIAEKAERSLVLSADTIVVLDEEILEKPVDAQQAFTILQKLSGKTHQVITAFGMVIKELNRSVYDYEVTKVTFRNLSAREIRAYIDSGEPLDKAGAYGAQGHGALLIKSINGCFYNVVGLPLAKFFNTLETFLLQL